MSVNEQWAVWLTLLVAYIGVAFLMRWARVRHQWRLYIAPALGLMAIIGVILLMFVRYAVNMPVGILMMILVVGIWAGQSRKPRLGSQGQPSPGALPQV